MHVAPDGILAHLERLVAQPTAFPPGDTSALCADLAPFFERIGFRTALASRREGQVNLVASIGSGAPHLVFNAHVDTVAAAPGSWRTDPFRLTRLGDRLYGLGAANCKGAAAVHCWLAQEIAASGGPQRGTVTFTFVADEESLGIDGMAFLRESGRIKPDLLCLGAPTGNALITAERGVMWVRISATGRSAHAGAPHLGENAVERLLRLVAHLRHDLGPRLAARRDGPLQSTINLGRIEGGRNTNVVPDAAWAEIDRRLMPSETVFEALAEIEAVLTAAGEPAGTWSISLLRGTNGFASAPESPLVEAFATAIKTVTAKPARFADAIGASDGRWFAEDDIPIINFGPGGGAEGHAADEWVSAAELIESAAIHRHAVGSLVGLAD